MGLSENQAKRRFIDLTVNEVSLVDSPANEQEFIVIKRLEMEENKMSAVAKPEAQTPPKAAPVSEPVTKDAGATPAVEQVAVEVNKTDVSAKVLEQVENIAKAIAGLSGAQPAATAEDVEKAKAKEKIEGVRKSLKDAGFSEEHIQKAVSALEAPAEVKKTEAQTDDTEVSTAKALDAIALAIQKAKTFTPKREQALKGVVEQLTKLLGELAPATDNSNTLPSGAALSSGLSDVKKQMEDLVTTIKASFGNVETATQALGGRIEAIEKARNPSQSTPTNETATKDTATQKSFWAGVL
jgi:hypothetical protein